MTRDSDRSGASRSDCRDALRSEPEYVAPGNGEGRAAPAQDAALVCGNGPFSATCDRDDCAWPDGPCAVEEVAPRHVLTVYAPRWHGFAKWTTEILWPVGGGVGLVEPQHSGFVRRSKAGVITAGVITQQLPTMRLSRRTARNLALKAREARIVLPR
jgi:hypothetical protein